MSTRRLVEVDEPVHGETTHTCPVAVTVARLCHYPVKGLAGRELETVALSTGRGLPFDRALALTNGTAPWTEGAPQPARTLLLGQATNPGLTRLRLDVDDEAGFSVTVTAPDDSCFRIDLDDADGPGLAARRRAQLQEETSLDCRMAASVSDEAVAATHVAMALETVALLQDEMGPDDAIMHYVRYFNLPSVEAQIIFRRTLATWAERHAVRDPAPPVCATVPLQIAGRVPLGLRVAG